MDKLENIFQSKNTDNILTDIKVLINTCSDLELRQLMRRASDFNNIEVLVCKPLSVERTPSQFQQN